MSKVDNARAEEINKAITERNAINRQLIQAKTQLNQQTTIRRKSELTHEELKNLPEETIVYRAIGRMFLRDDLAAVNKDVQEIISGSTAETARFEKAVETLQKKLQTADKDVKEMMNL